MHRDCYLRRAIKINGHRALGEQPGMETALRLDHCCPKRITFYRLVNQRVSKSESVSLPIRSPSTRSPQAVPSLAVKQSVLLGVWRSIEGQLGGDTGSLGTDMPTASHSCRHT